MAKTLNQYLRLDPPTQTQKALIVGLQPTQKKNRNGWDIICLITDPETGQKKVEKIQAPDHQKINGHTILANLLPQDKINITTTKQGIHISGGVKTTGAEITYTTYRGQKTLLTAKKGEEETLYGVDAAKVFLESYAYFGFNGSLPYTVGAYAICGNDTGRLVEIIHSVDIMRDTYSPDYSTEFGSLDGINYYPVDSGTLKIESLRTVTDEDEKEEIFTGFNMSPTSTPVPAMVVLEDNSTYRTETPDWGEEHVVFNSAGVTHSVFTTPEVSALYRGILPALPMLRKDCVIVTGEQDGVKTLLRVFTQN